MVDREEYKCIVCGEEKNTLIAIHSKADQYELLTRRRGICKKCLNKDIDIEKYCFDFVRRKLKENIQSKSEAITFLNKELMELEEKMSSIPKDETK